MNRILTVSTVALFVFAMSCRSNETSKDSFNDLKISFVDPPADYRPAPFWVWNTEVTRADIDRMLDEFKSAGMGGVFIHPRPGLITEYLSDEWFDLCRYGAEKAEELGLKVWLYDENSYPSGFAGGHVPADMPESYNQGQGLVFEKVDKLPDDLKPYFICLMKDGESFKDITPSVDEYRNTEGDYYLYKKTYYRKSAWHGGFSYVDLLYPGVTEKFMETTMSGYEKHLKEKFGSTVAGIFTDEPNTESPGGIRWTPDLFAEFRKRWGYDPESVLPLLVEETGNWKEARHNYMEVLLQMFVDRWAKPWNKYCADKNLSWTGHYWEHEWPDMRNGGDNMAMYAWHQTPAIDMLFHRFDDESYDAQFGNIRSVKELRSVANQTGRKRTLSETYGGGTWALTFADLKRYGDWEYALGVNFMVQHIAPASITGVRKTDYPPMFTPVEPWWPNYKTQADHFGRLSLALSKGEQFNEILVIEPTTSAWLYYSYVDSNEKLKEIGQTFQNFITDLEKKQTEYDLGSENIIKDLGSVAGGRFVVGKRAYKKVIIPPGTENLNSKTFKLLDKFVESGGELIAFSTPDLIDGKPDSRIADLWDKKSVKKFNELTDNIILANFTNDKIMFKNVKGNDLYYQRRTYSDGMLLFFVNSSLEEIVSADVTVKGKDMIMLDTETGEFYSYPNKAEGKNVMARITLHPSSGLLLFCSTKPEPGYKAKPDLTASEPVESSGETEIKPLRDNIIMLDYCELTVDGQKYENEHTSKATSRLFNRFGFPDGNPWLWAVQYRRSIVDRDTFKTGDIRVKYPFRVSGNFDKSNMRLISEQPELWKVKINGKPVAPIAEENPLDSRFGMFEIGDNVVQGENIAELSVSPMSVFAEIEPVYVTGNFSVEPAPKGWEIKEPVRKYKPGSWRNQGLSFYPWEVSYTKTFEAENLSTQYVVKLNEWKGTVSEVFVNGRKAGIIAYKPYTLCVTPHVKEGENKIEIRVTGSLKNLFGPHHNKPDSWISGPWNWTGIDKQGSGKNYDLLDYGMFDDFELLKML